MGHFKRIRECLELRRLSLAPGYESIKHPKPTPPFPPLATIFFYIFLNKYMCICGGCSFKDTVMECLTVWLLAGN